MSSSTKPLLAITLGDPAGIGPEIIVGAWTDERIHAAARLVAVGHPEFLRRAARLLQKDIEVVELKSPDALRQGAVESHPSRIACINPGSDEVLEIPVGGVDARAGEAAFQAVCLAATMAIARDVDGIVTAPLSKAALHAAGHHYPGHTELLAEMCGVADFAMMLYLGRERGTGNREQGTGSREKKPQASTAKGLGVVHVTLHQSLRSVFADLTPEAILAKCRLIDGVMRRLGTQRPRIAVCALNPHAGEDGLFGDEEQKIIQPAVDAARKLGLDAAGPFPADTLMMRAADGEFDAIVAMYHDQGHIALKLLGMHFAVNITLGLPIVRTSVAHGTAFDRAWSGTARPDGMVSAIEVAAQLAKSRQ